MQINTEEERRANGRDDAAADVTQWSEADISDMAQRIAEYSPQEVMNWALARHGRAGDQFQKAFDGGSAA